MFLRRAAIDRIGMFDVDAFPIGYGEENEWCQRAIAAGYLNLLAPRCIVKHEGSKSFGDFRRISLGEVGAVELLRRYPDYDLQVAAWIGSPASSELRNHLSNLQRELRIFDLRAFQGNTHSGARILFYLHTGALGGVELVHTEIVRLLTSLGFAVHTVAARNDVGLGAKVRAAGGSFVEIPEADWWVDFPSIPPAIKTPGSFTPSKELIDEVCAFDPALIFTQSAVIPQAALAARMLDIPHIWYLHELVVQDHGITLPICPQSFGELVLSLSAHVFTNSSAVRDRFFPHSVDKVSVLHPFPEIQHISVESNDENSWTVGVIGSLMGTGKRQFDAMNAVSFLLSRGERIRLVLQGYATDAGLRQWRDHANQLGIADLVEIRDHTDDRYQLYGDLDVVATPSINEAFGRTPFEAARAGKPVIYSDSTGPSEYLIDGFSGLKFRAGDHVDLGNAILRLKNEPGLSQKLVENARATLLSEERKVAFASTLVDVLERVARKRKKPNIGSMLWEMSLRNPE